MPRRLVRGSHGARGLHRRQQVPGEALRLPTGDGEFDFAWTCDKDPRVRPAVPPALLPCLARVRLAERH